MLEASQWKIFQRVPNAQAIADGLKILPKDWGLTPLHEKKPYRNNWQHEELLAREFIAKALLEGEERKSDRTGRTYRAYASGYGLRTGDISNGIVCIDVDGTSAEPILTALSKGDIPATVSWTSGKPGRRQIAFKIPEEFKEDLKSFTRAVATEHEELKTTSGELLEFRYNGCQSALPPSLHPDTGGYYWLNSPADTPVALAPDWLCHLLLKFARDEQTKRDEQQKAKAETGTEDENWIDNPWDIRNLAQYLDGYTPHGRRRGWITCKCPAHNGNSFDSLHIEESTGAFKCWAGCETREIYRAALAAAQSRGYQLAKGKRHFKSSGEFLYNIRKQIADLRKKCAWRFGKKGEFELEPDRSSAVSIYEFSKGDRLKTYYELASNFKYILDCSGTGSGKSHDVGNINLKDLGVQNIFYVSTDARNSSTESLSKANGWQLLEGRHAGLKRDDLGKWRRVKPGEPWEVSANCSRTKTIDSIRSLGIGQADKSELVCRGCSSFERCRMGTEFGYLNNRANTLKFGEEEAKKLLSHPNSLPSAEVSFNKEGDIEVFPYEDCGILWDEAGVSFKNLKTLSVTLKDLEQLATQLLGYPELLESLRTTLDKLSKMLRGETKQPNKFGWSQHELLKVFQPIEIDLDLLGEATKPDLSSLNPTSEYGADIDELPANLRAKFTDNDEQTAQRITEKSLKQWIVPFLKILSGERGYANLKNGVLNLTIPDNRFVLIAKSSSVNIFLDATATPEELAKILGVSVTEIAVVRESAPSIGEFENLEITQVSGLGRMGISRGNDQKKRGEALIKHIKGEDPEAICIRFKRDAEPGDFRHFIESRGVNDGASAKTLIIDGIPTPNLEALKAEFTLIYGRLPLEETTTVKYPVLVKKVSGVAVPKDIAPYFEVETSEDIEFRQFCHQRILAILHQEIGRLRANRRPGEQLKVYLIGDYPLDIPVTLVKARDITPEAASKTERLQMAVKAAYQQLLDKGLKPTQQAISEAVGVSQQHVSKILRILLIGDIKAKSVNEVTPDKSDAGNQEPPSIEPCDEETKQYFSQTYLPALSCDSPEDVATQIELVLCGYADADVSDIWEQSPAATQIEILSKLFSLLPPRKLEDLATSV